MTDKHIPVNDSQKLEIISQILRPELTECEKYNQHISSSDHPDNYTQATFLHQVLNNFNQIFNKFSLEGDLNLWIACSCYAEVVLQQPFDQNELREKELDSISFDSRKSSKNSTESKSDTSFNSLVKNAINNEPNSVTRLKIFTMQFKKYLNFFKQICKLQVVNLEKYLSEDETDPNDPSGETFNFENYKKLSEQLQYNQNFLIKHSLIALKFEIYWSGLCDPEDREFQVYKLPIFCDFLWALKFTNLGIASDFCLAIKTTEPMIRDRFYPKKLKDSWYNFPKLVKMFNNECNENAYAFKIERHFRTFKDKTYLLNYKGIKPCAEFLDYRDLINCILRNNSIVPTKSLPASPIKKFSLKSYSHNVTPKVEVLLKIIFKNLPNFKNKIGDTEIFNFETFQKTIRSEIFTASQKYSKKFPNFDPEAFSDCVYQFYSNLLYFEMTHGFSELKFLANSPVEEVYSSQASKKIINFIETVSSSNFANLLCIIAACKNLNSSQPLLDIEPPILGQIIQMLASLKKAYKFETQAVPKFLSNLENEILSEILFQDQAKILKCLIESVPNYCIPTTEKILENFGYLSVSKTKNTPKFRKILNHETPMVTQKFQSFDLEKVQKSKRKLNFDRLDKIDEKQEQSQNTKQNSQKSENVTPENLPGKLTHQNSDGDSGPSKNCQNHRQIYLLNYIFFKIYQISIRKFENLLENLVPSKSYPELFSKIVATCLQILEFWLTKLNQFFASNLDWPNFDILLIYSLFMAGNLTENCENLTFLEISKIYLQIYGLDQVKIFQQNFVENYNQKFLPQMAEFVTQFLTVKPAEQDKFFNIFQSFSPKKSSSKRKLPEMVRKSSAKVQKVESQPTPPAGSNLLKSPLKTVVYSSPIQSGVLRSRLNFSDLNQFISKP